MKKKSEPKTGKEQILEFLRHFADRLESRDFDIEYFDASISRGLYKFWNLDSEFYDHVYSGRFKVTFVYKASGYPKPNAVHVEEILP